MTLACEGSSRWLTVSPDQKQDEQADSEYYYYC